MSNVSRTVTERLNNFLGTSLKTVSKTLFPNVTTTLGITLRERFCGRFPNVLRTLWKTLAERSKNHIRTLPGCSENDGKRYRKALF